MKIKKTKFKIFKKGNDVANEKKINNYNFDVAYSYML